MISNRIFKRQRFGYAALRAVYRNVTEAAHEWGFPFEVHLDPNLLHYLPPHINDDEDGSVMVGHIVTGIDDALSGGATRAVRYGTAVGLEFELAALHRRRRKPEILHLLALVGPCHAEHLSVFVMLLKR